jgi:hypothetical protein
VERAEPTAALVDLRPKWERGQVIRYRMTQNSSSAMPDGQDSKKTLTITNDQTIEFSLRVREVNRSSGEATVEMVYDAVKIKLDGGPIEVDFDSKTSTPKPAPAKKPAGGGGGGGGGSKDPLDALGEALGGLQNLDPKAMLNEHFQKMVGMTLTMTIDSRGVITSVSGGSELDATGLLSAMGGGGGAGGAGGGGGGGRGGGGGGGGGRPPPAAQLGGSIFGPIGTAESGFTGLARVGQKWTHVNDLSVGPLGAMKMITEHTLKSASRGVAELTFAGRVDPKSADQPATAQLNSATQRGTYSWDTARGQLISMTMEQRVAQAQPGRPGSEAVSTTRMKVERLR